MVYYGKRRCLMYQAIKTYCENGDTSGLFLMDMPTGFGKTYSVLKYIFEACQLEENRERRYFFITPLKKNLPIDDLKGFFQDAEMLTQFDEKFLFIDSTSEAVLAGYTETLEKEIPAEITKTEEFRNFQQELRFLKAQRQKRPNDSALRQIAKGIEKSFRERTEPTFRRMLSGNLAKKYTSVKERLAAIRTEKEWKWVGKLYPAVFTQDKQIIFMSMDKFLARNATIVEPSYQFYNNKIIDNAIIFIDEFDSTKETMLKNIIQNGLRDKIDFIELFRSIYSAMETHEFPTMLTTPSEQRKKSEYSAQSLEKVLSDTRQKAQEIHDLYTLQFSHRTAADAEDAFKNFLFQDHQFHSILNGTNNYITAVTDQKSRINAIHFTPDKPTAETQNIQVMLGKLRGFIQWFQGTVNILAINYRQCKNERRQAGEDEFTQEQAIRSVLAQFRLSSYETDYLTAQVMMASRKQKNEQIASSEFDRSVYEHGFRYYCFENDAMHDMQSQIMMCAFQNTPEKLLLRFCERAKVIGISATATVPTVIGNFDLDYLRSKMQSAFYELPSSEYQRLAQDFHESQCGYQNIQIHTELIGAGNYSMQTWIDILDDNELAEEVFNRLERDVWEMNQNSYNKERYARIAKAFKSFLIYHKSIQSMLCLLTKHPGKNDRILDYDLLIDILDIIAGSICPSLTANKLVVRLTGDEYDSMKNSIRSRLEKGDRIFVISTYQTLGAGQNLQYPIPEAFKGHLICSNNYPPRSEKDFDAVYLDKPTNLFVNMEQNWQEESFVKYLFQVEFLQENAELSMADAHKHIKKAFRCYMTGEKLPEYVPNVYDKKSIRMYATRAVIQAIGRMCRTNQKSPDIYIFADDRIADCLDLTVTQGRILNHEFQALVDAIQGTQQKAPVPGSLVDKAQLISNRAARDIDYMLQDGWTEGKMKKWTELRRLVLQYPTVSAEDAAKNFIFPNYYVQLSQKGNVLYYSQEDDFRKIEVSFLHKDLSFAAENEFNTRLPRLMQWDALRQYFLSQGYATCFAENDFIMSPPLWNNIYKGALGEAVGQFWFKEVLGIKLEELTDPDQFELFDFKVPAKPVFVDFKNWDEATEMDWNSAINKIRHKAEQCGCKCVIIANVITKNAYKTQKFMKGNTAFLTIPSLLRDNAGTIAIEQKAVDEIRRCLNAYTD